MKKKISSFIGMICNIFDWLFSLFYAKEVLYLSITVVVLFCITFLFVSHFKVDLAFCYLFDAEKASDSIAAMIFFFITWLVGGGVLVSVMIQQYYRIVGGETRRFKFLVNNHIVVLGWDDGIMAEIQSEMNDPSVAKCYVITKQNVLALKKAFQSVGLKNVIIYKGDYDNEKEWRYNLQIEKAHKVFIAGELDEEAHDARVRLLFDKLSDEVKAKTKVNIHDFGLAKKLISKHNNSIKVFENFHLKWAEFLCKKFNFPTEIKNIELFIVGFGAMGKAIAINLPLIIRDYNLHIYVTDDDNDKLLKEKTRYDMQFGKFKPVEQVEWKEALDKIGESIANNTIRIVTVAKKRSEKGLLCMMDIISKFEDNIPVNLKLALNQEIDGYIIDTNNAEMMIGEARVILFGMKKGC